MKVVAGQNKKTPDSRSVPGQRDGLRRKIQVAKAQTKMPDLIYRDILRERFGVETSTALTIKEMEEMVSIFIEEWGWVPSYRKKHGPSQVAALQERIWKVAGEIPGGKVQLAQAVKDICGVDKVAWCKDHKLLTRLLAAMENIKRREVPDE